MKPVLEVINAFKVNGQQYIRSRFSEDTKKIRNKRKGFIYSYRII
jgi:hypothetical protein